MKPLDKILGKKEHQSVFDFLVKEGVIIQQPDGFCEWRQADEVPKETVERYKKVRVV